jgi:hypothetical protein
MPDDEQPGTGGDGSYTARPSKEPPSEGVTRDEDEEAVERTDGEHEVAHGEDAAGSRGVERGTGDGSGVG